MADHEADRFVGVNEAAQILGVSVAFLRKWRRALPAYRLGGSKNGRIVFKPAELVAWAEARRLPPITEQTVGGKALPAVAE